MYKRIKLGFYLTVCAKINSKWITDPKARAKTRNLLEKKTLGIILCDFGLGNVFLNLTPKAQMIKKIGKLNFIKIKNVIQMT